MRPALSCIVVAIALLTGSDTRASDGLDQSVQQTQRLSAWLDANAEAVSTRYPLGLMWLVADERAAQERARAGLLQELARLRDRPGDRSGDLDRLIELVKSMPVTGRVRTDAAEARWLEADPSRDPLLQPGDRVVVPARPRTVAVLRADGRWCHVIHVEAAVAAHYLDRCSDEDARVSDWAWVAQPDGRVQKAGVAPWNTSEPQQVAPGARIWAPPRGHNTSSHVDEALANWLSWQGAAADPLPPQPIHALRVADAELRHGNRSRAGAADNGPTASDWGFVGLLQTPTARMREPGSFSLNFHRVWPYTQGNVFLQPLEPLEVGFRYTDVANKLYGSAALSGTQSYKDKSIDLKLRLWRENHIVPELAVGVLDMGGTGLFGSEYLVASKRWGAADFSLGLAWGYLGNRQDADNPLAVFGDGLKSRPSSSTLTGQGGTVGFSRMFRGPVGLFGGVQYRPSGWPLLFKAELDGNDYSREPKGNAQPQKWPVNLGLVYQPARSVDVTLAFERGNKASVGIALKVPLANLSAYKSLDPPAVPVSTQRPAQATEPSRTLTDIAQQTGWQPEAITRDPRRFQVDFSGAYATYAGDRLDRTFSVLHRDAPASVETLEIRLRSLDEVQLTAQADRNAWVRSKTEPSRSNEAPEPWQIRQGVPSNAEPADPAAERYAPVTPRLGVRPAIDLIQTLGGPDGFVLYQLSAAARATLRLPAGWVANGHARLRLIDNYDRFRYDGPSQLPRVRTLMREYLTTSRVTLSSLTLSKSARLGGNHFYSVYGGYFEPMFGGVGAEWLYRQTGSRWAFGIDANRVRQRDFHQDLRWRDYQVNTGHATVYWDTGWNGIKASVAAGQYLAGDRGATVVLQKVFANGVTMAAFATKTNVSAAKFGEGSFDKGLFVTIPFDAFLPRSSSLTAGFLWRPLTRDGGAILSRPVPLIGDTYWLDPTAMSYRSAPLPNDEVPPDDRVEPWTRQP